MGLNHAIELSEDGKTLYSSSVDKVYSWPYNGKTATIAGDIRTVIQGMYPGRFGHETRTLELSKKAPGMMLVSLGSAGNFDKAAKDIKTGISQIRAFNISSGKTYNYTDGEVIGWGLRNSVGLAESPQGGIWSNENGSDDVSYGTSKIDVHENSPGEEINYHGSLVGDRSLIGKNYGYPHCAAMWSTTGMTEANLKVGQHFAANPPPAPLGIGEDLYKTQGVLSNAQCQKDYVAPRLTVPPHWAPLDIKFNSKGSVAYMTAHGSW